MADAAAFSYEAPVEAGIAGVVRDTLLAEGAAVRPGDVLEATVDVVQSLVDRLAETQPPPRRLACSDGCWFCCTGAKVHVTALEALAVAEHLASDPGDDVFERVVTVNAAKRAFDPATGRPPNYVCPLLVEGRCRIYDTRPFVCRGFNSYDARACERFKVDRDESVTIEGYVHPHRIMQCASRGFQRGIAEAGLDGSLLDLAPALSVVLGEVDARQRWLAGEAVFAPAAG